MKFFKVILFFLLPLNSLAMDVSLDEEQNNRSKVYSNSKKKLKESKPSKSHPDKNLQKRKLSSQPIERGGKAKQPQKRQKYKAKTTQKEKVDSCNPLLYAKVDRVQKAIENAQKEVDWGMIYTAFREFHALEGKERDWQFLASSFNAYKWPSQQNWKEVVGGHLFFPSQAIEWELVDFEAYRLKLISTLWSFAVGAKYEHALSKFFLVRTLDKIRSDFTDASLPDFFKRLYTESFSNLVKCVDNPDACFVIGYNFEKFPYVSSQYLCKERNSSRSAEWWHNQGNDLKNQYCLLELQRLAPVIYEAPIADKYLALARKGFPPAYEEGLNLTQTPDEQERVYREAIENGYPYVRFGKAKWYEGREKLEKARKQYLKMAEEGISYGYICSGITLVGDLKMNQADRKNLKEIPPQDIEEAIKAFRAAGKANHPEGWVYLAMLYQELWEEKLISVGDYRSKITDTLNEGMLLGSASCYHKAHLYLPPKIFTLFMDSYGLPPQHELRHTIEYFINNSY